MYVCMYVRVCICYCQLKNTLCQIYLLSLQFTTDVSSLSITVSFAFVTNSCLPYIAGPQAASLTMIHILY